MRSLIAYLLLLNYIDPQEDKKIRVNKIPIISAISVTSVKRISAVEKVWVIVNYLRL